VKLALAIVAGGIVAWLLAIWAPAAATADLGWHHATASAYSTADSPGTEGCTGRRLSDSTRTFASLIVPCGARVEFCVGRRCAIGTRTDSGPYVAGRQFDLTLGMIRALGFAPVTRWGVREVTWRLIR
jgi:hypothetical protein